MPESANTKQTTQEEKQEQLLALGGRLKSLREAQGLSVADISKETKIQKQYIEAMESGRLEILPKGPYTRSFLKQYCAHLSALDLWNSYDALTQDKKLIVPGAIAHAENTKQSYYKEPNVFKHRSFIWIYAIVIASLCAAAWITWQYRSDFTSVSTSPVDGGTTTVEAPAAPEPILVQTQNTQDAISQDAISQDAGTASYSSFPDASTDLGWMDGKPPKPAPAASFAKSDAAQPQAKGLLRLTAKNVVWIKVSKNRSTMFEGLMQQGESKEFFAGDEPLRVRYGNPGATVIFWNGQTTDPVDSGAKPVTRYYHPDGTVTDKY